LRFIDASTFLYAFLRPRKSLPPDLSEMKAGAQRILRRVDGGEVVITSVVHVSEVANILEARIPLADCRRMVSDIVAKGNVEVVDVTRNQYMASVHAAEIYDIGVNDALAFNIMQDKGLVEVYSFDRHFDDLPGIERLTD